MRTERYAAMALSTTHLMAGVVLLLLSGWFIAASAVAGLAPLAATFNYVIPAAMIRFLALLRILAGYGEKYFGHAALLDKVSQLRLSVFDGVMNGRADESRAEELERLGQHTDALASRDIAALFPLISAAVLALLLSVFGLLVFPPLLLLLAITVPAALLIVLWQWRCLHRQRSQLAKGQTAYTAAIEHYLTSASLWHHGMSNRPLEASQTDWQSARHRLRETENWGDWRMTAFAMSLLLFAAAAPPQEWLGSPYLMLGLFFCLSLPDWLGPAIRAMSPLAEAQLAEAELHKLMAVSDRVAVDGEEGVARLPIDTLSLSSLRPQRGQFHESGLDLTLRRGELALVQGSSGSGKSSLLLAIAGLLPMSGKLLINGGDVSTISPAQRRRNLLYIEQFPVVLADTLRQNLLVAAPGASDDALRDALVATGLEAVLNDGLDQWLGETGRLLSGGEKKRLGIARALLSDAPVWLMDEPFEGLDQAVIERLSVLLSRERESRILIVVSHRELEGLQPDVCLSLDV